MLPMSHDARLRLPCRLHAEAPVEPACRGSFLVRFRKRARSSRPLGGFPHSGSATDYRIVSTSATPCLPGSGMSDGRKCARRLPHFCIGWAARSLAGRGRRARRSFCASGRKFPCAAPSCPVSSFLASGRGRIRKASAGVAELADAYGSGPYGGNPMKVQVLSPAPLVSPLKPQVKGLGFLLLAGGSPSSPVWGRWRHREQTPAPARIRGMSDGRLACAFNRPLRPPMRSTA